MLITTKELLGKPVLALDGSLGHVENFLFDDKNWVVRYIVISVGNWLSNRLVLLSPHVLIKLDTKAEAIRVRLHRRQIAESPAFEPDAPVSRREEEEHYRHFGLPEYWTGNALWGQSGQPLLALPATDGGELKRYYHRADKHLESANSVTGFKIQASGQTVGHLVSLWIDDSTWEVHDLVIRAGHWYLSREVLLAPSSVKLINHMGSTVIVTQSKEDIQWTADKGRTQVQPRVSASEFTQR